MIDPYKMVFVNIILSGLVFLGYFFYQYIYPKKKVNLLALVVILSSLVCISIFRKGVYESGDFTIHLYRVIEFYKSLNEGNLMPSWAAGLNATYGYPLFIFNYTVPYYVISFFHFIGFSFIASMKLFLAISFILSGVFMYLAGRQLLKNDQAAFITAIFYQFAPYHLVDLHFKVVIGELMVFTLIPLGFYSLLKLWQNKNLLWFSMTGLSIALLIMSHVVIALFCIMLFVSYGIFIWGKTKQRYYIIATLIAVSIGTLGSVYIWLTPFIMAKYTHLTVINNFVYFPEIWELLFSPWMFGLLFQGHQGELSYLIGYGSLIVITTFIVLLFRKKLKSKFKHETIFWLIMLLAFIFLIIPLSKPLWGIAPFLKITGSHRLLVLVAFICSILAGYFTLRFKRKKVLLFFLVCVTVFSTLLNWGHRRVITDISDREIIKDVWISTAKVEGHFYANPKWVTKDSSWFDELPKAPLEIVKGTGEIQPISRNSTSHTYVISAKDQLVLRENTVYFPGWQGSSNGKAINITPDKDGLISFELSNGLHYFSLNYDDIPMYKLLKVLSGIIIVLLVFTSIISFLRTLEVTKLFKRFLSNNK